MSNFHRAGVEGVSKSEEMFDPSPSVYGNAKALPVVTVQGRSHRSSKQALEMYDMSTMDKNEGAPVIVYRMEPNVRVVKSLKLPEDVTMVQWTSRVVHFTFFSALLFWLFATETEVKTDYSPGTMFLFLLVHLLGLLAYLWTQSNPGYIEAVEPCTLDGPSFSRRGSNERPLIDQPGEPQRQGSANEGAADPRDVRLTPAPAGGVREGGVINSSNANAELTDEVLDCMLFHYCKKCRLHQPRRAKHCHLCKKCVLTYDHHCFWIGRCVGEFNHWRFYLFLIAQTTMLVWDAAATLSAFKAEFHVRDWLSTNAHAIFFEVTLLALLMAVGGLLVYHTYLLLTAQTTWEHLSRRRIDYLIPFPRAVLPFSNGGGPKALLMNFFDVFRRRGPPYRRWEFKWRPGEDVPFNPFDNDYYDCGC